MKSIMRATVFGLVANSALFLLPTSGVARAQGLSTLTVHVTQAAGGPLGVQALVTVASASAAINETQPTAEGGVATFVRLPAGTYSIQVSAAGYEPGHDSVDVEMGRGRAETFVTLSPTPPSTGTKPYSGMPLLTGDAAKEVDAAIKALQANDVEEASQHAAIALKSAPGHPDVQYVAALCAQAQKDWVGAEKYYEAAIGLYPDHVGALVGISGLLLQQNKAAEALPHLQKALALDANSWRIHWLIAEACIAANQDAANAKVHASRAIQLGGEKAANAQVTLARAEILLGDKDSAKITLEKFLRDYPSHPNAARARALLRELGAKPESLEIPEDVSPRRNRTDLGGERTN